MTQRHATSQRQAGAAASFARQNALGPISPTRAWTFSFSHRQVVTTCRRGHCWHVVVGRASLCLCFDEGMSSSDELPAPNGLKEPVDGSVAMMCTTCRGQNIPSVSSRPFSCSFAASCRATGAELEENNGWASSAQARYSKLRQVRGTKVARNH